MQIIADENIPHVTEAFSSLGQVKLVVGRKLTANDLGDAEILLVRSVTKVNQELLANSSIRFVGSATIGLDHIDLAYLEQQSIHFANAAGSNANAVTEYVISSLVIIAEQQGFELKDKKVGIIGCGHVGSKLLQKLQVLEVSCLIYDPLLQAKTNDLVFSDLNTVLSSSDIISLHIPLEKSGLYPTHNLVNADFLKQLKANVILINTSRGGVIDETALLNALQFKPKMQVVLDVWQNEPNINLALLNKIRLGTPHIAGHSFDGKIQATEMLYNAVNHYLQKKPVWQKRTNLPAPSVTHLSFSKTIDDNIAIKTAVLMCYDIRRDDAMLRNIYNTFDIDQFFDNLRKNYSIRREFNSLEVQIPIGRKNLAIKLTGLGFRVY
ncbi:MAG: 4-phosphoerythronate dehydrogenase [Thiomargarita sp.]|nr:4-phosphoerythronate dehydrogenase [Thiomargarita sp.]